MTVGAITVLKKIIHLDLRVHSFILLRKLTRLKKILFQNYSKGKQY